jgi:predicted RNA-binding protein YlxR (DUF448 family)
LKNKKIPMRRCVGCMNSKPKKELIRIITTAEGDIKVDTTGKANGRGVYLCLNKDCITAARKKKVIARDLQIEDKENKLNQLYEELLTYAGKDS